MQNIKDLVFFDKNGVSYDFDYDSDKCMWTGSILIEPVSKGLFETQKIIVLQKYLMFSEMPYVPSSNPQVPDTTNVTNTYEYGYPASLYGTSGVDSYEFEWDMSVSEVDEIQMFGFDRWICPPVDTSSLTYNDYDCPEIAFMPTVSVGNLAVNPVSYVGIDDPDTNTGLYTIKYAKQSTWMPDYAEINLCFCNRDDDYSTFRRDLLLYYVDSGGFRHVAGRFSVYAKSVEEDERLTVMCGNLGYDINNVDFSIFQDSDIKEHVMDNVLMNSKRKEAIMEGHNIYSYIGSYKSVINAIRFFGYDNVTIKEWWKNVDVTSEHYGKHFMASSYSLENHEVISNGGNVRLPSKKYRKTGKLTLAYKINDIKKVNGNVVTAQSSYQNHPYPETDEKFAYTIEEAVIKLYGLKRKLEKDFLPLTTRIIDITGEADAFYANVVRSKPSQMTRFEYISGPKNTFSVLGSQDGCFYIEDLRPFGIHDVELPHGDGIVGTRRTGQPGFIGSGYNSLYDTPDSGDSAEFGDVNIGDYNQDWSVYSSANSPITDPDAVTGYSHDWDLDTISDIQVAGGLSDIEGISGMGTCDSIGSGYEGPTGVVPPYELDNNSLFAVLGGTVTNCNPWIYYVMANTGGHGNYYVAEFSRYFPNLAENAMHANMFDEDTNRHLPDNENIPVGALVELSVDTDESVWDEFVCPWNDAGIIPWNYIDIFADNISRVEWVIHKDETETPEFDVTIGGMISHGYSDIGVVLPYTGCYDVTMKLYDWNNNVKITRKECAVTVCPKEVEFTGWCRMLTDFISWDDFAEWDNLSCTWEFPYANNLRWDELRSSTFDGMDRGFFIGQYEGTSDVDESVMIYNFDSLFGVLYEDNRGAYFWDNLDIEWQRMDHLNWNMMCITGDVPCYFEFGYFDASGNPAASPDNPDTNVNESVPLAGYCLEVIDSDLEYGSFVFPQNVSGTGLNYIAEITRKLNETSSPVLSRFHYSYVWDLNSSHSSAPYNLDIPDGFHIVAVAKKPGRSGDVTHVGIVSPQNIAHTDGNGVIHAKPSTNQLRFFTNSVECNPNWNDVVCINNITEIPAYTDVNFNYSNCRIWGKKNPQWTFRNLNSGTTFTSDKRNYHRMFKERGCWEVTLRLEDTNGNKYTKTRNMFIVR